MVRTLVVTSCWTRGTSIRLTFHQAVSRTMLHQCGLSVESLTCRIFCSLRPVQACRVVETVGAGQHGACVYVHLGWCFFNLLACLYLCVRVVFPVASTTGSVVLESSLRTRPWSGCSDSSSLLKENLLTCAIFLKK